MVETDERSGCWVGAAIIDPFREDGIPRCLIIPVTWIRRPDRLPDIKFPGGMHKVTDKDFEATLRREIFDETDLQIKPGAKLAPPIAYRDKDGRWKYLYLMSRKQCRGRRRRGSIRDGESILGEPQWLTYEELKKDLFPTHRFWLPCIEQFMQRPLR